MYPSFEYQTMYTSNIRNMGDPYVCEYGIKSVVFGEKKDNLKQDELWANAHLWYPHIYVQCV